MTRMGQGGHDATTIDELFPTTMPVLLYNNQAGNICGTMSKPIQHLPIEPMPELSDWANTLQKIASKPLAFCEEFPTIARRFEAFWNQELLDRPIFIAATNADPSRPITRRLDLLDDPDAWLEAKLADMKQLHRVGDTLPAIRVDFGPVLLGPFFGGELQFGNDTSWTHAFINDDWSNAPDWTIHDDNPWWIKFCRLLERVSADAAGKYLVCSPDLGASADVLLNLRGSSALCIDVLEKPEKVELAINAIYPAWHQACSHLYRETISQNVGLIHWLGIWSNVPHITPACDFNFMIGPDEFNRLFLPDIARQAATLGRAVFHLDGPGAARHIDALLDVPDIQAIQFTPGTGTPSALAWVDMFRKIQNRGRSVVVNCPPGEVLALCDALRPEGLVILIDAPPPAVELDDLFAQLCRRYV